MITIFEEGTTEFLTHGLGDLPDALICEISRGINSSEYDLYMEYPDDGINAEYLAERRILYADVDDARHAQPFEIYSVTQQIGRLVVKAEHVFHYSVKIPIAPFTLSGLVQLPQAVITNAMIDNPFTLQLNYLPSGTYENKEVKDLYHLLGGEEGSVLQKTGCEFDYDHYTIKVCQRLGADHGVVVAFGKNLKDLAHEINVQEVYTGAVCKWIAEDDGTEVHSDIAFRSDHADFTRETVVIVDKSADYIDAPTKQQLDADAAAYVTANLTEKADLTCTIDFIPIYQQSPKYAYLKSLERVELGDTVTVEYITDNREISSKARVVRTVFDAVALRYISLEIGSVRSTLGDYLAAQAGEIKENIAGQVTEFERIVEENTSIITGSQGGHIVLMRNADGTPEEILILDTDSVVTANSVARFNKDGIAFSTHGINGPYETAVLLNGSMTASWMNTIRLNAQQIVAGVLQVMNGQNEVLYVDVDTGVVRIVADSFSLSSGETIEDVVDRKTAQIILDQNGLRSIVTDLQTAQESTVVKAETYYLINMGSTPPTSDVAWTKTPRALAANEHLWQMTETTLLNGTVIRSTPVDMTGAGVISATMYYAVSSSSEYPSTSSLYLGNGLYLTSSTFLTTASEGWSTTLPTFDPDSGLYLWERWKLIYADGSSVWTTPVCAEWYRDIYNNLNGKVVNMSTEISQSREQIALRAERTELSALEEDLKDKIDDDIRAVRSDYTAALTVKANEIRAGVSDSIAAIGDQLEEKTRWSTAWLNSEGLNVEDSEHGGTKSTINGAGFYVVNQASSNETLMEASEAGVMAKQLTSKDSITVDT